MSFQNRVLITAVHSSYPQHSIPSLSPPAFSSICFYPCHCCYHSSVILREMTDQEPLRHLFRFHDSCFVRHGSWVSWSTSTCRLPSIGLFRVWLRGSLAPPSVEARLGYSSPWLVLADGHRVFPFPAWSPSAYPIHPFRFSI